MAPLLSRAALLVAVIGVGLLTGLGSQMDAQAGDKAVPGSGPVFVPPVGPPVGGALPASDEATDEITDEVVGALQSATRFCGALARREYVVDCLSERLANAALKLPRTGDYAEAAAILDQATRSLAQLAQANRSDSLPVGRATQAGGASTSRPLVPVDSASLNDTLSAAMTIVSEAETLLLRSSANSDRRSVHYQRIAQAVGSTKVLLRSA